MNPRITKLSGDIERTREKITEMQARLRDLERQKTELENAEYVALIRELDMTPQELAAFLRHTHGGSQQKTAAPVQMNTKQEVPSEKE